MSHVLFKSTSCSPPHIGPAIPEMNTAWFTLWVYDLLHAGPPSVLYAAGTRVPFAPKVFDSYDTVLVTSWAHESQEVAVATLLVVLNDSLTYSPVLVTGHNLKSSTAQFEQVPFPLPSFAPLSAQQIPKPQHSAKNDLDDLLGFSSSDPIAPTEVPAALTKDDAEYKRKLELWATLLELPAVKTLADKIDMTHSLGYISLMKVDQTQPSLAQYGEWIVTDVHFGLPLFEKHANRAACDAIVQRGLFTGSCFPGACMT